jgi:hypothetical protein
MVSRYKLGISESLDTMYLSETLNTKTNCVVHHPDVFTVFILWVLKYHHSCTPHFHIVFYSIMK